MEPNPFERSFATKDSSVSLATTQHSGSSDTVTSSIHSNKVYENQPNIHQNNQLHQNQFQNQLHQNHQHPLQNQQHLHLQQQQQLQHQNQNQNQNQNQQHLPHTKLPGITPPLFTPGGRRLPPLEQSSNPGTPTTNLWNSLLSASNNHQNPQFSQQNYNQFMSTLKKTGLTPNESNLRTGLTPGGLSTFGFGGGVPGLSTPGAFLNGPITPGLSNLLGMSGIGPINHSQDPLGPVQQPVQPVQPMQPTLAPNGSLNSQTGPALAPTQPPAQAQVQPIPTGQVPNGSGPGRAIDVGTAGQAPGAPTSVSTMSLPPAPVPLPQMPEIDEMLKNSSSSQLSLPTEAKADPAQTNEEQPKTKKRKTTKTTTASRKGRTKVKKEDSPSKDTLEGESQKENESGSPSGKPSGKPSGSPSGNQNGNEKKNGKEKEDSKATEEEKRKSFLERNRVAASKCRQRKKQLIQKMEDELTFYSNGYRESSAQVTQLRAQLLDLRNIIEAHKNCPSLVQYCGGAENLEKILKDATVATEVTVEAQNNMSSIPSTIPTTLNIEQ